jgi:hypothetical protein
MIEEREVAAPVMIGPASVRPARFFLPLTRVPAWLVALLGLMGAAIIAGTGYAGFIHHPDVGPPTGERAEQAIAGVFGRPGGKVDDRIIGDYVVERFYILDLDTGRWLVGDLLKGEVTSVIEVPLEDGNYAYSLVLDRAPLIPRARVVTTFIAESVPPNQPPTVTYLGAKLQAGGAEVVALNFDRRLPERFSPFGNPTFPNPFVFLEAHAASAPRLLSAAGMNYLLSNTHAFPYFEDIFGINRAAFVSYMMVVDATSSGQSADYYRVKLRLASLP